MDEFDYGRYQNALLPTRADGSFDLGQIADPAIVRGDDGYCYVFSTCRVAFRSKDCCQWEDYSSEVIARPTWGDDAEHGIPEVWAPDVAHIGNKWIYYYSLCAWDKPSAGIGYATSDHVGGPYVDQGKLFDSKMIEMAGLIDPAPFIDDDGSIYLEVGSFSGNFLVQLTADGMGLYQGASYQNEHKVLIAGYDNPYGYDNTEYEGGYLVKHNGKYFFFGSSGSCCAGSSSSYTVWVGMADKVSGPYYDDKGRTMASTQVAWAHATRGRLVVYTPSHVSLAGPGHNSVLRDDQGNLWLIYHCYCLQDNFATRHLFMDKLIFDEKGFPHVDTMKPSYETELDGPLFKKETLQ